MRACFRRRLLRFGSLAIVAGLSGPTATSALAGPMLASAALAGLLLAQPTAALAAPGADEASDVQLPPGPLNASLFALAQQTGVQIVFTSELVQGRRAPAVSGRLTADQALARLIAGSDLEAQKAGPNVLVLKARGGFFQTAASRPAETLASGGGDAALLAQAPPEDPTLLSEIVVGSHIRGVKDGATPVVVLSRDALDQAGQATVAEALAALPQAFNGTASEDTSSTGSDPSGTNTSRSTGVNLRGLGADATLVLVNGRRLAGTGLKGDFADVSSIPTAAIERVEVLLGGASALYGSDAVGGVVNIVLRKRFDGAETRLLAGGATQGGASIWSLGQTIGKRWDTGSLLVSYEHSARDRLKASDRVFTANADLRPLGGTDHRRTFASPGNIMRANATGAQVPTYAIPAGQNGVGLTPASFLLGQVNLENYMVYNLLPRQLRDNLYVALNQDLGPDLVLTGDARLGRRTFTNTGQAATTTLTVNRGNPYFVSPTGAASERINYSFLRELGGQRVKGKVETLAGSLGIEAKLPRDWRLEAYGAYGADMMVSKTNNLVNTSYLSEAMGTSANNPLTTFNPATDGYFNPFIGQGANPANVLKFVGAGYQNRKTRSDTQSLNAKLDGSLAHLPAGALGLAVGVQVRREGLKANGETFLSGSTPSAIAATDADRTVKAAFAELRAPIFGEAFRRPGFERLELSAAVRREDYGHGLASTDPKLDAIWSPLDGATLKASWGTSFRAPALTETTDPQIFSPTTVSANGSSTIVMVKYGGNPGLKPETATSKTLTLELEPKAAPGLKATVTAFQTRFIDKIGTPGTENWDRILTAAEFAPFRTLIQPASNTADRALIQALLDDPRQLLPGYFPVESYGAIIDGRYVNTGQLLVRGIDGSVRYATKLLNDPLVLSADATWLIDYQRKVTPGGAAVDRAGFARDPADFKARAAASWTHGPVTTLLAVNRTGDLKVDTGSKVQAWTTVDLNLGYAPPAGRLKGMRVALNIQNLFDADPPFYDSLLGIGYDAANADPIGRRITVQLTKTW